MAADDITVRARRRLRIPVAKLAAVTAGVAATVAGVAVVAGRQADPQPTPAASPQATTAPTIATAQVPAAIPGAELTWTEVAGVRVPISPTAGPRDTGGGRARGFSHDATGALLAAIHISLRLSPQAGPAVFTATLRQQVVGVGAAALGQQLAADYEQARQRLGLPYGAPAGRLYAQLRGYRIDADTPEQVALRLLVAGPGRGGVPTLAATAMQLQWISEDWALVAPPGGDWSTVMATLTTADGYTPLLSPGGG